VLISQNRSAQCDAEREDDDLRVLTGIWAEQIEEKLGVRRNEVERAARARLRDNHDL
jgi:uncharacterized membrane protein